MNDITTLRAALFAQLHELRAAGTAGADQLKAASSEARRRWPGWPRP